MIFLKVGTGDYAAGVVGDNLAASLAALAPTRRVESEEFQVLPGPLLHLTNASLQPIANLVTPRRVGYAIFEEDVTARQAVAEARQHFAAIVTACEWCRDVLCQAGLHVAAVIPHGVDTTRFHPSRAIRTRSTDTFVVFSGGKFEYRKGQDIVVSAFKTLAERHADVMLLAAWYNPWQRFALTMADSPYFPLAAGTYASFDALVMHWLRSSGIDLERVQIVPRVPNADLAAIYGNSDVGLFPNRCEGATNMVMMEYMACGKPVIATDCTGHRDLLTDENSMRLKRVVPVSFKRDGEHVATWFEPDLEEVIEALEGAYQHRAELPARGMQAALSLEHWTWERTARRFLTILEPERAARAAHESSVPSQESRL